MYESVEDLPYEDEERFEQTALQYQEKYHKISNKYQKILMQESTVSKALAKESNIKWNYFAINGTMLLIWTSVVASKHISVIKIVVVLNEIVWWEALHILENRMELKNANSTKRVPHEPIITVNVLVVVKFSSDCQ